MQAVVAVRCRRRRSPRGRRTSRSRSASTGRGSSPLASCGELAPVGDRRPSGTRCPRGCAASSPDGRDAEGVEPPGRGGAHAPQGPDGQRVEERQLLRGQDHDHAGARVGARRGRAPAWRRATPAWRAAWSGPRPRRTPSACRRAPPARIGRATVGRRAQEAAGPGHVDERLVERDALDHRARTAGARRADARSSPT